MLVAVTGRSAVRESPAKVVAVETLEGFHLIVRSR